MLMRAVMITLKRISGREIIRVRILKRALIPRFFLFKKKTKRYHLHMIFASFLFIRFIYRIFEDISSGSRFGREHWQIN